MSALAGRRPELHSAGRSSTPQGRRGQLEDRLRSENRDVPDDILQNRATSGGVADELGLLVASSRQSHLGPGRHERRGTESGAPLLAFADRVRVAEDEAAVRFQARSGMEWLARKRRQKH